MHDVVRDVAIFIATKEGKVKCNECQWSSSFLDGGAKSSCVESGLSSLRLLWIDFSVEEEFQFNSSFVEETTSLNVLIISFGPFRSLPNATGSLHNVRTLILYKCKDLETISIVGKLENLEILRCYKCPSIEELPSEIGKLIHLRLLELSKCENLETAETGVISKLVKLEELKMVRSFKKWGSKNKRNEKQNANLSELEALSKLTHLEIEVEDSRLAMEPIKLGQNIRKYDIIVGESPKQGPSSKGYHKRMSLFLERDITSLGSWIHQHVPSVEFMCLTGDGSSTLDLARAKNLKSLTMKCCWVIETLVGIPMPSSDQKLIVFPLLEYLQLNNLPILEEICPHDGPTPSEHDSFKQLKELWLEDLPALKHLTRSSYNNLSSIYLEKCDGLRSLASLSTTKDCLSQLKMLIISYCTRMEEIFVWNNEQDCRKASGCVVKVFPNLETLDLSDLPNLKAFYKGVERIEFPVLSFMSIVRCPKLGNLVSQLDDDKEHHSSHFLCPSKVSFGSLDEVDIKGFHKILRLWCNKMPNDSSFTRIVKLRIDNCGKVMSSFPSSIAQSLVKLRQLKVLNCVEMIQVIEGEDEDKCDTRNCCLFPELRYLEMKNLPKLEIFCEADLELRALESVFIQTCPRMKRFSSGSLNTPNLITLKIDGGVIDSNDINGALLQH